MNRLSASWLLLLLAGCNGDTQGPSQPPAIDQVKHSTEIIDSNFIDQGQAAINALETSARQLNSFTGEFLENNSPKRLQALQQQWLKTHNDWHRAAFYLRIGELYPDLLPDLARSSANIHQRQIQPGYLDDIEGYPGSGLVHDINIPITADNIRQQHQRFDEEEVTTGLNAMEFELWSHHIKDFDTNATVKQSHGGEGDQLPQQRRRALLRLLSELLIEDIQQLSNSWPSTAERINTLDSYSDTQLYRQLATIELIFLLKSLQTPHTIFSHDNSWQSGLLENLQELAIHWSDSSTLKQFNAMTESLNAKTKDHRTHSNEQLRILIKLLEDANKPASGE